MSNLIIKTLWVGFAAGLVLTIKGVYEDLKNPFKELRMVSRNL